MTELEKLIKTVADGLKSMAQGVEKLAEKIEGVGKSLAEQKPESKRKAPAKPKKAVKKTAAKRGKQTTASDTVLNIIKRTKNGVDTNTLMEKTGYDRKKVSNIIYKLKKKGMIKSAGKGVYIKT